MIGVLVNTAAVIIGSILGMVFKNAISHKVSRAIMTGLGLCVIYVGVSGALVGENPIIAVIAMSIGGMVGTIIDIDKRITNLGEWVGRKFKKEDGGSSVSV